MSPEDGARVGILGDVRPTLKWSSVTDPSGVTFDLQVDTYPELSQPLIDKSGIPASRYTPVAAEALPRGQYYWRVKAVNGASVESAWSQTMLLNSGLPPWVPLATMIVSVVALAVGAYFILARARARRRAAVPVPALGLPQAAPGGWRVIQSGQAAARLQQPQRLALPQATGAAESGEGTERRRLPWRLALPQPAQATPTLSTQDQARLVTIIDFAQSLPLAEPGYDPNWLLDMVVSGDQTQTSSPVYESLLRSEVQVRYDPAWMRHPVYHDLTALLEGQSVLQDLTAFVDSANQCAAEAASLLQQIYRDATSEAAPDLMDKGGWAFVAAVYTDALSWFRGKSLRDPAERDYKIESKGGESGAVVIRLYGEEATPFAGLLAQAPDEEETLRLRSLHLSLRRRYRNNDQAISVTAMITELQVQRSRLLSVFSQFDQLKQ